MIVLEKIKAHYNPIFNESEGFIVPIFDNSIDPGNHLVVTFKKNAQLIKQVNLDSRSKELPESALGSFLQAQKTKKAEVVEVTTTTLSLYG